MSKVNRNNHREFFLSYFSNDNRNEVLELHGFILFKHWDGNHNRWTVDLFTPESYKAMKDRQPREVVSERLF